MTGHHPISLRDVVLVVHSYATLQQHRQLQQIEVADEVQELRP